MSKPMKAGTLPKILKWVGYGTAILSLVAGLGKITKVISDRVEARRNIRALLSSEEDHDLAILAPRQEQVLGAVSVIVGRTHRITQ